MYLVDTSIWLDYLAGRDAPQVYHLRELLGNPLAVGITDLVLMEILQGARDQKSFDKLLDYFSGQRIYRFANPAESHVAAAKIYFDCRRKGVTVRSTVDCLIAQCAIENELILLHHDNDFKTLSGAVKSLRQKHFLR